MRSEIYNLQLTKQRAWPTQRAWQGEAATGKVGKQIRSWHCSTNKGTWVFLPQLSILYCNDQISKCGRVPCSREGAVILSPLTLTPGWQFPRGTAEINAGLPWWRWASSLAAVIPAFYLQLTDGDKGSLKAILRQLCIEQDKWGSRKVPLPWKPSATNTLLSSVRMCTVHT